MATITPPTDLQWVRHQIRAFVRQQPRYEQYAQVLKTVLEQAVAHLAPQAIVQVRAKSLASYAEKIQRKIVKYRKLDAGGRPLHPITDLCGARVITLTLSEVKDVCRFIESHFDIDHANSLDVGTRLNATEFGYLSVHYVVRLRRGVFPTREIPVRIPAALYGLAAEIQVRTLLEHAWAAVAHESLYKSPFTLPPRWQRELARLAAALEEADGDFGRVQDGLATYRANYGAYMTPAQIRAEIGKLATVRRAEPRNASVAHRIACLAMCLEDWDQAVAVLQPFARREIPPLLRDLGIALCKRHQLSIRRPGYRRGQRCLERAVALAPQDADAIASLAGTWKQRNPARARTLYRQAFEIDPVDPYALGNYLEAEIAHQGSLAPVAPAKPLLRAALRRCREQAEVGMNLPWAYWDLGKFALYLGDPYASLSHHAKALSVSSATWMIDTSRESLGRLGRLREPPPGWDWAQRLLVLALAARAPRRRSPSTLRRLASRHAPALQPTVVVVAGGCDRNLTPPLGRYRRTVAEAFRGFTGTVLAGGTTTGVSRLVGDAGAAHGPGLRAIGYVPRCVTDGVRLDRNRSRYRELRRSQGHGFSPLEPLQAWADILAAGIPPAAVKLLGVNGGPIAAAEYRIALTLGAVVGIVVHSGGAADELLADSDWNRAPNLLRLPNDPLTLRLFLAPPCPVLKPTLREPLARAIHELYRVTQAEHHVSVVPWDQLPENLRASSRFQADHIFQKLRSLGYEVRSRRAAGAAVTPLSRAEVETLAEIEHARWCLERLAAGWRYGEQRSDGLQLTPHLIPWSELGDDARDIDRRTVRAIPEYLATVGLAIGGPAAR